MASRLLVLILVVVVAVALGGCGSEGDAASREHSIQWGVFKVVGDRTVRIVGQTDHCAGHPKPRIVKVLTRYQGRRAYITALLRVPREAEDDEGFCAGLELFVYRTIKLDRDVTELSLFDSSIDPPARRWPMH